MRTRDELPAGLGAECAGSIEDRRATHWDLAFTEPIRLRQRVHFVDPVERRASTPAFARPVLAVDHPLLVDYREPTQSLSIARAPDSPGRVLQALLELVRAWSGGWRSLDRYVAGADPLGLLMRGEGELLAAPVSLVADAERLLAEHGAGPRVAPRPHTERALRVLCLGPSFVVARHFEFEALAPGEGGGHGHH